MPTQEDAPDWIMNEILKGKYDAAGAMQISSYHQHILHEKELIASGQLRTGEPFDTNRRKIGEGIHPDMRKEIDEAHAQLPPHSLSDSE